MTGRILFVAANPSVDRLYEVERLAAGAIHRQSSSSPCPAARA
jgi:fructose-1-phosphate kinase PfkB-like protein